MPGDIIDNVCRAITERHRRRILGYLREADEGMATIDELLDTVASVSPHSNMRLRIALYTHLKILDEAGIIEYGRRSNIARYHGYWLAEEALTCVEAANTYDYRSADSSEE